MDRNLQIFERFARRVLLTDTCWEWQGARINHARPGFDYGQFRVQNSNQILAHLYSYMIFVGPHTSNQELDHLCRNPHCVNPNHLEAVTHQLNVQRGSGVGRKFTLHPKFPALSLPVSNELRLALHNEAIKVGISTTQLSIRILEESINVPPMGCDYGG